MKAPPRDRGVACKIGKYLEMMLDKTEAGARRGCSTEPRAAPKPYLAARVQRSQDDVVLVCSRGHPGQGWQGVLAPLAQLCVPVPGVQPQPLGAIVQDVAAAALLRLRGAVLLPLLRRGLQVIGGFAGGPAGHALVCWLHLRHQPPHQEDDLCGTIPGMGNQMGLMG